MIVLFALLLAQVAPPERSQSQDWLDGIVPAYLVDLFMPMEYQHGSEVFHYRLFAPITEKGKKYPILVWTSGYGEFGYNNFAQLRHLHFVFDDPSARLKRPFYCLVMQVPESKGNWFETPGQPSVDEPATVLMEILHKTISDYPIDPDRIYIAGVSAGGLVCWELVLRYPNEFAAAAPMASLRCDYQLERLRNITHVPIWAFHSANDPIAPIQPVRDTVEYLRAAGGNVHLTEIDSDYHDCWTDAFREYHLLDWLVAQRRNSFCWCPPGRRTWDWKLLAIEIAMVTLVTVAIAREWKRRRNASS